MGLPPDNWGFLTLYGEPARLWLFVNYQDFWNTPVNGPQMTRSNPLKGVFLGNFEWWVLIHPAKMWGFSGFSPRFSTCLCHYDRANCWATRPLHLTPLRFSVGISWEYHGDPMKYRIYSYRWLKWLYHSSMILVASVIFCPKPGHTKKICNFLSARRDSHHGISGGRYPIFRPKFDTSVLVSYD